MVSSLETSQPNHFSYFPVIYVKEVWSYVNWYFDISVLMSRGTQAQHFFWIVAWEWEEALHTSLEAYVVYGFPLSGFRISINRHLVGLLRKRIVLYEGVLFHRKTQKRKNTKGEGLLRLGFEPTLRVLSDRKEKSNETPAWCKTVQVLFLQSYFTCFEHKRPSSGVFKTSTAAIGTCVL